MPGGLVTKSPFTTDLKHHSRPVLTAVGTCATGTAAEGFSIGESQTIPIVMWRGWPRIKCSELAGRDCTVPRTPRLSVNRFPPLQSLDKHDCGKSFANETEFQQALFCVQDHQGIV